MRYLSSALLILLAVAACSTLQSRIHGRQAEFDAYPPEVQKKIRAGSVDVGFTHEQVSLALRKSDRTRTRKLSSGEEEVWVYGIGAPRPNTGLVSAPGAYVEPGVGEDEMLRVIFQKGLVVRTEKPLETPP
jgi:hypothetical protein